MHEPERIAVSNRFFVHYPHLRPEILAAYPKAQITFNERDQMRFSDDELVAFCQGADAVVIGLENFNERVLARLPDLKVIACCSAGIDHLDPVPLKARGIRVGWAPGINTYAVAELAISLMINVLRNAHFYQENLTRDGSWPSDRKGMLLRGRSR